MLKINKIPPFVKWTASIITLMLVICFFIYTNPSVSGESEEESASLGELEAQVTTESLKTGELPVIMKAMGTCVADRQSSVAVVARIQGIVKEVAVLDGEEVEKGQVIAKLEDSVVKGNYEKARSALQTAEAELKNAENGGLDVMQGELDLAAKDATVAADKAQLESKHEDELMADSLTSAKAAKDARNAMESAVKKADDETKKAELFRSIGRDMELKRLKAAVGQTRAEFKAAQWDLESSVLRAPLKGRVGDLKASEGSSVEASTIIAQIESDSSIAFRLWISPQNAKDLTLAYPVSIYPILSDKTISAKISSIGGGIDEETGLTPVDARPVDKAENMRINEAVTADITTGKNAHGFLVPASSITIEDDKASVFLVDDKNLAHAVPVTVLSRNADQAVIEGESLKTGSQIITDGNYNLPDGAHIKRGVDK
jgi:multidrug efflux pump subunit AcrA (membrane-fusion protein)